MRKSSLVATLRLLLFAVTVAIANAALAFNVESLIPKGAFDKKTEKFQEFSRQTLFFRVEESYPADKLIETILKRLARDRWTHCGPAVVNWERYVTTSSKETKQEDLGKNFHFIRKGEVLHIFFSYQLADTDRVPPPASPLSASAKYAKLKNASDAYAFLAAQEIKCEGAKKKLDGPGQKN